MICRPPNALRSRLIFETKNQQVATTCPLLIFFVMHEDALLDEELPHESQRRLQNRQRAHRRRQRPHQKNNRTIVSPGFAHKESLLEAIKLGKRIFREKPLCTTAADCLKVIDAEIKSGEYGEPLMVHLRRRRSFCKLQIWLRHQLRSRLRRRRDQNLHSLYPSCHKARKFPRRLRRRSSRLVERGGYLATCTADALVKSQEQNGAVVQIEIKDCPDFYK